MELNPMLAPFFECKMSMLHLIVLLCLNALSIGVPNHKIFFNFNDKWSVWVHLQLRCSNMESVAIADDFRPNAT